MIHPINHAREQITYRKFSFPQQSTIKNIVMIINQPIRGDSHSKQFVIKIKVTLTNIIMNAAKTETIMEIDATTNIRKTISRIIDNVFGDMIKLLDIIIYQK